MRALVTASFALVASEFSEVTTEVMILKLLVAAAFIRTMRSCTKLLVSVPRFTERMPVFVLNVEVNGGVTDMKFMLAGRTLWTLIPPASDGPRFVTVTV